MYRHFLLAIVNSDQLEAGASERLSGRPGQGGRRRGAAELRLICGARNLIPNDTWSDSERNQYENKEDFVSDRRKYTAQSGGALAASNESACTLMWFMSRMRRPTDRRTDTRFEVLPRAHFSVLLLVVGANERASSRERPRVKKSVKVKERRLNANWPISRSLRRRRGGGAAVELKKTLLMCKYPAPFFVL